MAPNYSDEDDELGTEDEEEEEEEVPVVRKRQKKWKDPNKPKRAMSAFFLYSQANRPRTKEENPEAGFGDLARILAQKFRELPEKEKRKWEKKASEDKLRYQEEMKHYVPAEDPTGGGTKKKAKKDPNAPKRNMSAYFLFSIDQRPVVKSDNPDASFGDIARITSQRFKALPEKEKKIWQEKAAADKERYLAEMQVYRG